MSGTPVTPVGFILQWARSRRFPALFGLAALLFVADLLIPDLIPFVDELLLGLVTLMLGSLRRERRAPPPQAESGPVIDITPSTDDEPPRRG